MTKPLKQAIEAAEFCIKHTYNARMKDEDIAIWSVGTSSKPRITLQTLKVLIQAAESALKLEEALGVAEKALQVAEKHMTLEDMLLPECPELGSALDIVRKALTQISALRGKEGS